jgi:hypothetical protein
LFTGVLLRLAGAKMFANGGRTTSFTLGSGNKASFPHYQKKNMPGADIRDKT